MTRTVHVVYIPHNESRTYSAMWRGDADTALAAFAVHFDAQEEEDAMTWTDELGSRLRCSIDDAITAGAAILMESDGLLRGDWYGPWCSTPGRIRVVDD